MYVVSLFARGVDAGWVETLCVTSSLVVVTEFYDLYEYSTEYYVYHEENVEFIG